MGISETQRLPTILEITAPLVDPDGVRLSTFALTVGEKRIQVAVAIQVAQGDIMSDWGVGEEPVACQQYYREQQDRTPQVLVKAAAGHNPPCCLYSCSSSSHIHSPAGGWPAAYGTLIS